MAVRNRPVRPVIIVEMDKSNIVALPHDRLRQKSTKVSVFDAELKNFVADMRAAALDWEKSREHETCVGLAAVQVDELRRVVIIREDLDNKADIRFITLINPKIIKAYGPIEEDYEGCLSVRDIYAKIPRHAKVKIKAQDEDGKEFRMSCDGFQARLLQHEIDHTNGIVIIDHVKDDPEAFFKLGEDGEIEKIDYVRDIKDSEELWD